MQIKVTNRCRARALWFRVWPVPDLAGGVARQYAYIQPGESRVFRIDSMLLGAALPIVSVFQDGAYMRIHNGGQLYIIRDWWYFWEGPGC